jgi:hypothetical protein
MKHSPVRLGPFAVVAMAALKLNNFVDGLQQAHIVPRCRPKEDEAETR